MGDFTDDVHATLCDALATRRPTRTWTTERYVQRTPVDVTGESHNPDVPLALVEVEMRRADPANNPVKLARHAADGEFDASVVLVQVFSGYYDLAGRESSDATAGRTSGVSSKRENAEFVGRLAEESVEEFDYRTVDLRFTPPVRGDDPPADWRDAVGAVANEIDALL